MYYEFKFPLSKQQLGPVKELLDLQFENSDPYPFGRVSSLYYDSPDLKLYELCINGLGTKQKFRLRSYKEDGVYHQFQVKTKSESTVKKVKVDSPLLSPQASPQEFSIQNVIGENGEEILYRLEQQGHKSFASLNDLLPTVEIVYDRFRYREYDYRITLDTNIRTRYLRTDFNNTYTLPQAVLEIKTTNPTPHIPLLGFMPISVNSFSKYKIALNYFSEFYGGYDAAASY